MESRGKLLPAILIFLTIAGCIILVFLKMSAAEKPQPRVYEPIIPKKSSEPETRKPVENNVSNVASASSVNKDPEIEVKTNDPPAIDPEIRRQFDAAMNEVDGKIDRNMWADAAQLLVDIASKYPDFPDETKSKRDQVERFKKEAIDAFNTGIKDATALLESGKFFDAALKASQISRLVPDMVKDPSSEQATALNKFTQALIEKEYFPLMVQVTDDSGRTVFTMDKFETTVEQYLIFCALTERKAPQGYPADAKGLKALIESAGNIPITGVSFEDASAFAAWTGRQLPTEEEWELAAGTRKQTFPWGEDFLDPAAKSDTKPEERHRANTLEYWELLRKKPVPTPGGTFANGASKFGIYDLSGNVWEMTSTEIGGKVVVKGGSFQCTRAGVKVQNRLLINKNKSDEDIGFRCIRK